MIYLNGLNLMLDFLLGNNHSGILINKNKKPKKGIEPSFYRHEWYVLTF